MPKILLAEDDATMVGLLKTLLKMEGFNAISLSASQDVLTVIKKEKPDVVMLDIHLFNKNGLEILDSIRKDPAIAKTRIVMASGLDVREECMKHGANAFLLKPFMPDDLIKLIR